MDTTFSREVRVANLRSLRPAALHRTGLETASLLTELFGRSVRPGGCAEVTDELQSRIEARVHLLLESVERDGFRMSGDGRVSESAAGTLLGFDGDDTLKKLREYGRGPNFHRIGVGGSRISYALDDLAAWIESKRVEQG